MQVLFDAYYVYGTVMSGWSWVELLLSLIITRALQPAATCRQSPYIVIVTLCPRSHYDVIRYWAGHADRDGCKYFMDTLPHLIYKDVVSGGCMQ